MGADVGEPLTVFEMVNALIARGFSPHDAAAAVIKALESRSIKLSDTSNFPFEDERLISEAVRVLRSFSAGERMSPSDVGLDHVNCSAASSIEFEAVFNPPISDPFRSASEAKTERHEGGRPPTADWEVVKDLLRIEIASRGFPGKDEARGWRTQADVIRFVQELLQSRNEEAAVATLKRQISRIIEELRIERKAQN